jgi:hypothetical protein
VYGALDVGLLTVRPPNSRNTIPSNKKLPIILDDIKIIVKTITAWQHKVKWKPNQHHMNSKPSNANNNQDMMEYCETGNK